MIIDDYLVVSICNMKHVRIQKGVNGPDAAAFAMNRWATNSIAISQVT